MTTIKIAATTLIAGAALVSSLLVPQAAHSAHSTAGAPVAVAATASPADDTPWG